MVTVSVGYKQFAVVQESIGRLMEILGVRITCALVSMSDLHQKFSGGREFQQHVVGIAGRQRRSVTVIASDPDVVLRIDIDAVLAFRPVVAAPRTSPALDE